MELGHHRAEHGQRQQLRLRPGRDRRGFSPDQVRTRRGWRSPAGSRRRWRRSPSARSRSSARCRCATTSRSGLAAVRPRAGRLRHGRGGGHAGAGGLEFARARGARIYAEVLGYGITNDAYNMIAPLPGRAAVGPRDDARRWPRRESSRGRSSTSTLTPARPRVGDTAELLAIQQVFGVGGRRAADQRHQGHARPRARRQRRRGAGDHRAGACTKAASRRPSTSISRTLTVDLDLVPRHGRDQQLSYAICELLRLRRHQLVDRDRPGRLTAWQGAPR